MDRSRHFLAVALVAAALSIPTVAASWSANGDNEPDTAFDRTEGRMFLDPDQTAAGRKVYFNGWVANYPIGQQNNLGRSPLGGASHVYAGNVQFHALLGLWKDCNKDGYVGMAETALVDYLAELDQHDASVCPATPRGVSDPPVHNDGTWIKEFIMIGTADPCSFKDVDYRRANCANVGGFSRNPDVLYANDTFLWTDDSAPGQVGGGVCPIRPIPRGSTASTGGLLYFADCFVGRRVANTVNSADTTAGGNTGLRFENPHSPQTSSSKLNQEFPVNLFGNPYHSKKTGVFEQYDPAAEEGERAYRPMFTTADCSSTRTDVRDPTAPAGSNGTLNQVGVKAPAGTPGALVTTQGYLVTSANFTDNRGVIVGAYGVKPTTQAPGETLSGGGSAWAGLEDANDGVYSPTTGGNYQTRTAGDCDRSTNNTAHQNYEFDLIEEQHEPQSTLVAKISANQRLTWFNGGRGVGSLVGGNAGNTVDDTTGTHTWPRDAGVNRRNVGVSPPGGASWNSNAVTVVSHQAINRNTLEAHPAFYRTYYAVIGSHLVTEASLQLPAISTGIYGSEHCGTAIGPGQPALKGWACDPALWNRNPAGDFTGVKYSDGSRVSRQVGDPYTLRDVDCWDGSLGQTTDDEGIQASLVSLNGGPCKR